MMNIFNVDTQNTILPTEKLKNIMELAFKNKDWVLIALTFHFSKASAVQ